MMFTLDTPYILYSEIAFDIISSLVFFRASISNQKPPSEENGRELLLKAARMYNIDLVSYISNVKALS